MRRNWRQTGAKPLEIIFIVVVFSIVMLVAYLLLPRAQGGGLSNQYQIAQEILDEEVARMEAEFNTTIPPVGIALINETNTTNKTAGYYCSGTIELINYESWDAKKYRRIIIHELGHHYLRSVCGFDWPNELDNRFEEAFVEGYTISRTRVIWNHYDEFYNDFAYMPREFFECGFETCDPLGCYENITGKEWT